ncbi:hypothetical protein BX666DRAFT_2029281 [Dichotomocladium elegans]|nr:hypothetical protein BX666DRAFT_2029281 [Dichotomocladium elegans]
MGQGLSRESIAFPRAAQQQQPRALFRRLLCHRRYTSPPQTLLSVRTTSETRPGRRTRSVLDPAAFRRSPQRFAGLSRVPQDHQLRDGPNVYLLPSTVCPGGSHHCRRLYRHHHRALSLPGGVAAQDVGHSATDGAARHRPSEERQWPVEQPSLYYNTRPDSPPTVDADADHANEDDYRPYTYGEVMWFSQVIAPGMPRQHLSQSRMDASIPTLRWSQIAGAAAAVDQTVAQDECAVCLEEFKPDDLVRLLRCSHPFHQICIDRWLRNMDISCPVCRSVPI